MTSTTAIQRPRLLREGPVNIDEKMATLFVDKAMRAAQADLEADRGIEAALRQHGHSLGNVKGQERFMARHGAQPGLLDGASGGVHEQEEVPDGP